MIMEERVYRTLKKRGPAGFKAVSFMLDRDKDVVDDVTHMRNVKEAWERLLETGRIRRLPSGNAYTVVE